MRKALSGARPAVLTLSLALAATIVGCGSSRDPIASKTPEQILAASRAASAGASALKITKRASQGPLRLTSTMLVGRGISKSTLSFAGVSDETIRIGNAIYARGNARFYRRLLHGTDAHVPPGTWIKEPVTADKASLKPDANPAVRREINTLLANPGNLTKGSVTTVDGQRALALSSSSGRGTTTIYIAAVGEPYPIEIVRRGREDGVTEFSEWNRGLSLNQPVPAIDLTALRAGGALSSAAVQHSAAQ